MKRSCSFCREMNDIGYSRYCHNCGHRADVARINCDCAYCGSNPRARSCTMCDGIPGEKGGVACYQCGRELSQQMSEFDATHARGAARYRS